MHKIGRSMGTYNLPGNVCGRPVKVSRSWPKLSGIAPHNLVSECKFIPWVTVGRDGFLLEVTILDTICYD